MDLSKERHLCYLKSNLNHKKIVATLEDLPTPQVMPTSFAIAE
jgi:hypothetical protein